ncbi:hypothetical protein HDN1F_06260 [gamma proteobacterium HdN1]|nr:hypothetical protein HDN1F_06260 [gamma proteobacterium HdN1]
MPTSDCFFVDCFCRRLFFVDVFFGGWFFSTLYFLYGERSMRSPFFLRCEKRVRDRSMRVEAWARHAPRIVQCGLRHGHGAPCPYGDGGME